VVKRELIKADADITKAWQACVTQQGLKGWLIRTSDPNVFGVRLVFNSPTKEVTVVGLLPKAGFTVTPWENVTCTPSIEDLNGGPYNDDHVEFGGEGLTIQCKRNANVAVSVFVNASWRPDFDYLGLAAFPPPPQPPPDGGGANKVVAYKITSKGSLSLGTKPGINDGIVGCCTNFLGGPGTAIPIGSSIERDEIHDAVQLFRGSQPGVNDGYVTTVAGFKNGTYVERGYTIKEDTTHQILINSTP
jgi:hypothetical protein